MAPTKYYYAFAYDDELTTTRTSKLRLAGRLYKFPSENERDAFVEANHRSPANNNKPCHALKFSEARLVKYGSVIND